MQFDLELKFEELMTLSLQREMSLAEGNIAIRQKDGVFYTPTDVANFVTNEILDAYGVKNRQDCINFLKSFRLTEPSVGGGIFLFSILYNLVKRGADLKVLSRVRIEIFDLDKNAIDFVAGSLKFLGDQSVLRADIGDFLCSSQSLEKTDRIFLGNPPFVAKKNGKFPNIFADFVDISLENTGLNGGVFLIVPLSFCFGKSFIKLREKIRALEAEVKIFNFDNIPDSLFEFGKPGSQNTNRANSQRCSIICLKRGANNKIFSSHLVSWKKSERVKLFQDTIDCLDITDDAFNDQFARPANLSILKYVNSKGKKKLGDLIVKSSENKICLVPVARNFIGFRDPADARGLFYSFETKKNRNLFFAVINSQSFFDYWKTYGDGFHLTRGLIENFPLSSRLVENAKKHADGFETLWTNRKDYLKTRSMGEQVLRTYNFPVFAF